MARAEGVRSSDIKRLENEIRMLREAIERLRQSPIYLGLCIEATRAILEKYFGIPSPLATVLAYAVTPHIVPKIVD